LFGSPADLWLAQAKADLDRCRCFSFFGGGGGEEYPCDNSQVRCELVAKAQQATEKAIKALAIALSAASVRLPDKITHDVTKYITAIKAVPKDERITDVLTRIDEFFTDELADQIAELVDLAPSNRKVDGLRPRNTEYPYQLDDGSWRHPADPEAFSYDECGRFLALAETVVNGCSDLLTFIVLLPDPAMA
jgi:hypothetical protein